MIDQPPLIPAWLSWAISFHLVVQGLRVAFAAAAAGRGRSRLRSFVCLSGRSIVGMNRWPKLDRK